MSDLSLGVSLCSDVILGVIGTCSFSSRSCGLGRALVGRHSFAGYAGPGVVITAPVKISTGELRVTASGGVRVGVFEGDHALSPNVSTAVDGVEVTVTWQQYGWPAREKSRRLTLAQYLHGAVGLVFDLPAGSILYAYHV